MVHVSVQKLVSILYTEKTCKWCITTFASEGKKKGYFPYIHESLRAKRRVLGPNEKFEIFRWMYRSASLESNPLLFVIF